MVATRDLDPRNQDETHFPGPDTTRRSTISLDCPALMENHRILAVGHTEARGGNLFIRHKRPNSQALVSCRGMGSIWVNNRWEDCPPGTVYISPANTTNAYFATAGKTWVFSWVIFIGRGPHPFSHTFDKDAAYTMQADPDLLSHATQGLYNEVNRNGDPILIERWIDLINAYAVRALTGNEIDNRLHDLWRNVERSLSRPWSYETMAQEANVSKEHLRRLCHRHYGQTPMDRLRALRMRYVAELLANTDYSSDHIAEEVGYADSIALSRAFQRSYGISPAKYRKKSRNY